MKPTVHDLADSAGDLRRYAERFRQLASHGDTKGEIKMKSALLVTAGEFLDDVADELVALIGEHEPESPLTERQPASGTQAIVGSESGPPA
ncbi:MAG: hypothetical protein A2Y38_02165 [Spirochaetes bacterium GWB1_59_5]|nr:MAG: hypothetical protein A2Y38_02165 [Spirochaetes bacterium GWB1_59_5]